MTVTRNDIINAVPKFNNPKRNWSGMCEAAAYNLTNVLTPGYVRSFPTATAARQASKIEGSGFGPGQNWVWMSGVWGTENGRRVDFGHVAYHIGNNVLFMASSSVDTIPGYTALGFIDGNAYMRRFSNQKLEGWSWDHGGSIIPSEEDDMFSDSDRALLRSLGDRISSLEQFQRDVLKRDHDNIGEHITNTSNKLRNDLSGIVTREGRGARVYENTDTGQVVVISSLGTWWRDLTGTNVEAEITELVKDGWVQNYADRKRHDDSRFKYAMRNANRTLAFTTPIPNSLTGEQAVETTEVN